MENIEYKIWYLVFKDCVKAKWTKFLDMATFRRFHLFLIQCIVQNKFFAEAAIKKSPETYCSCSAFTIKRLFQIFGKEFII